MNDSYQRLYQQLDALMMIVPSMETVRQSRWLQEEKLRMKMKHAGESRCIAWLNDVKVFEYVDLFERHTLHMFEQMPSGVILLFIGMKILIFVSRGPRKGILLQQRGVASD